MKLTKKQERWIKELEELWNFFEARLKGYNLKTDDLRLKLLLALMVAAHRLIRGFIAQLKGGSNDNLQSKLRTLTEAFINVKYILSGENDFRAKAFILDSKKMRVRTLDKIIMLMEQEKAPSMAAINSLESYKELTESLKQEVSEDENRLGEKNAKWPSIEKRAKIAGLEEYYLTVFYFFSQDNHMSVDGLFRFLKEVNGVTVFTTELDLSDLDQEIQSAYVYYLQFIILCSQNLGFPTEEELQRFNSSDMLTAPPFSTE